MKKLTAGIFATILGLTAVDAFAAVPTGRYNVASVKYVDEAMKAVSGDVTGLETRVTANETAISTLNSEQDTQDLAIKAAADAAAAADAKAVANTALIGDVEEGKTVVQMIEAAQYSDDEVRGLITTAQAQADKGVADAAAALAAAQAADAKAVAADGKAVAAQNDVDALEGVVAGLETASGNYATKTELTDGLATKVDNSTYATDKAALESSISAADAKGEQGITDAAAALAAAQAADGKAVAAQGEVDALETNVANNYVAWTDVDDTYVANEYTF